LSLKQLLALFHHQTLVTALQKVPAMPAPHFLALVKESAALPIRLVLANKLPPIAPRQQLINRSGKLDPQPASPPRFLNSNLKCQILRRDPRLFSFIACLIAL
jgi:hypothetical protein